MSRLTATNRSNNTNQPNPFQPPNSNQNIGFQPPSYTLPGVLQFLQQEFRSFQRDRNEWDIERAELKAKVASLEGERRASDSIRTDLTKRIKMLEYALRQERGKYLLNQVNGTDGSKSGTQSSQSSEVEPINYAKLLLKSRTNNASISPSMSTQKAKIRKDKCREVLKMCLDELNTIPTTKPVADPQSDGFDRRHTYTPDSEPDSIRAPTSQSNYRRSNLSISVQPDQINDAISSPLPPEIVKKPQPTTIITTKDEEGVNDQPIPRPKMNEIDEAEMRQKRVTVIVPDDYDGELYDDMDKSPSETQGRDMAYSAASISKSAAAGQLSNILKALGKKQTDDSNFDHGTVVFSNPDATLLFGKDKMKSEVEQGGFSFDFDDKEPSNTMRSNNNFDKDSKELISWKPKLTLKSHLDTVRSIDFHEREMIMVSGSDDGTLKLWDLANLTNLNKKSARHEYEPGFVYRGHKGPVTCTVMASKQKMVYSSGFDGKVKRWKFPEVGRRIQDSTEPILLESTYIGHEDIVWGIKLKPKEMTNSKPILASYSADGTVKLFDTEKESNSISTLTYSSINNLSPDTVIKDSELPTGLDFNHADTNQLVVSYRNSKILIVDIETGKSITSLDSFDTYDGTSKTQISTVLSHPTMPLVISGHEDKFIRFFDINSGKMVHSMLAHLDAISSLDVSSSALTLVSGGHDASIRWWDLSTYSCIQEFSSHRAKTDETVYAVKFHPYQPWLGSAGADSIVKLFTI